MRLGSLDIAEGNWQAARDRFKEALDTSQRLAEMYPDVTNFQVNLSAAYDGFANLDIAEGNRQAARNGFQKMLEICLRLAKEHSDVPDLQQNLSAVYERLANLDVAEGNRHVRAASHLRQAEPQLLGPASDSLDENFHVGNQMFPANRPSSTYDDGWTRVQNSS